MEKTRKYVTPLLCWDIYSEYYRELLQKVGAGFDLEQLELVLKDSLKMAVIDKIKEDDYDALVLTDASQKIKWVSRGFSEMTGYPKSFAIGKSPYFLQGTKTSEKTKRAIRERLENEEFFTGSILNYRRNGEEYLCHIKIVPLFDEENRLSHYLAIERELLVA